MTKTGSAVLKLWLLSLPLLSPSRLTSPHLASLLFSSLLPSPSSSSTLLPLIISPYLPSLIFPSFSLFYSLTSESTFKFDNSGIWVCGFHLSEDISNRGPAWPVMELKSFDTSCRNKLNRIFRNCHLNSYSLPPQRLDRLSTVSSTSILTRHCFPALWDRYYDLLQVWKSRHFQGILWDNNENNFFYEKTW